MTLAALVEVGEIVGVYALMLLILAVFIQYLRYETTHPSPTAWVYGESAVFASTFADIALVLLILLPVAWFSAKMGVTNGVGLFLTAWLFIESLRRFRYRPWLREANPLCYWSWALLMIVALGWAFWIISAYLPKV